MTHFQEFTKGVWKENPVLVLLLGMCPTLAVTTSAINGFGMGACTMVVLLGSNVVISLMRKIIPPKVRIPVYWCVRPLVVAVPWLIPSGHRFSVSR